MILYSTQLLTYREAGEWKDKLAKMEQAMERVQGDGKELQGM